MKTEKEFMEDIYRKAAERYVVPEETTVAKQMPWYKRGQFIAAAVLAILLLPVSVSFLTGMQPSKEQTPEQHGIEPATYQRRIVESTIIFDGVIEEIEEKEGVQLLRVTIMDQYIGNVEEEVTVLYEGEEKEIGMDVEVGDTALFYVIADQNGYRVNLEENGVCQYVSTKDGYRVYQNAWGETIDTKEFSTR